MLIHLLYQIAARQTGVLAIEITRRRAHKLSVNRALGDSNIKIQRIYIEHLINAADPKRVSRRSDSKLICLSLR